VLASLATTLVCAATAAAAGPTVDVLSLFHQALPNVKHQTAVPVLLPASMTILTEHTVYASGSATKSGWELDLAFARNCGGADACFLADFSGKKGTTLPGMTNAKLANGDAAYFHASTCGASCAPASLWFVHAGVLYSWQDIEVTAQNAKSFLVGLANQAVSAGPR